MNKKLIILGMTFIAGMNLMVGCNKVTNLSETSKAVIEMSSADKVVIVDKKIESEKKHQGQVQDVQPIDNVENDIEPDEEHEQYVQNILDKIGEDEYIIDTSSTEELTRDDIYNYEKGRFVLFDYILNEIYARHGYVFNDSKYKTYFESKTWYQPAQDNSEIKLNPIEEYNVKFIRFFLFYYDKGDDFTNLRIDEQDIYEANQEIYLDINGDGKDEVIYYTVSQVEDELFERCTLRVNDVVIESEMGDLSEKFAIVDIDPTDSYKEIMLASDLLYKYYPASFYIFKDNKLAEIGETQGTFTKGIKLHGDGTFTSSILIDCLHTWRTPQKYYLDENHQIQEVKQELYEDNTHVFLTQSFEFYKEPNINSVKFMVDKGEVVTIVAGDLKEWFIIKTNKGETGWFRATDLDRYEGVKFEDGRLVHDVFEGLYFAD